jgi:hypothetical protein
LQNYGHLVSRRSTLFLGPKLSEKFSLLFGREGGDDFFEGVATEGIPEGQEL